jgi:alpha-D-ribose 1-methylphosphonate 5-triphosphate synthase subunit PhnG
MIPDQATWLGVLNRAPAETVKAMAEQLLVQLDSDEIEVLENRTGLVMLPATDTAQGAHFYLGEVMVSEAWVRVGQSQGYTICLGRDLAQAVAIALMDALLQDNPAHPKLLSFVAIQQQHQQEEDLMVRKQVAATRVEMEAF